MKKNTEARALIRQMALDAKTRMMNGGYGSRIENQSLRRIMNKNNNLKLYSATKKPEITIKIINDYDNNEFKQKVFDLLNENKDSLNPLSRLINQAEFENMSENEKEKTILNVSEQYTQIRNQYYNTYC